MYFKNIYEAVWTILIGMGVTFRHLFTRSVTLQYPHERDVLPERSRQKLHVNIDDCIGCLQCERACPVSCISIETIKAGKDEDLGATSNGQKKRLHVTKFNIDMAKCCYCADCVFPCPTECITMTPDFEFATYDRKDLMFRFSTYTREQVKTLKLREAEERKAKESARPAAPKNPESSN
jgi:NADH-quinone oxidoreductase subunit I